MQRRQRGVRIDLRRVFVAERAEAKHDAVHAAELVGRAADEIGMRGEIGRVECA